VDLQTGTQIDGRYTVQAELGRGGMAAVYKVLHEQLGTHHALKVLTVSSSSVNSRLLLEGRVQSQLKHRNIVAVTDVVEHDGASCLLMEYVDGPPLDRLLRRGRLTLDQADAIGRGVMAGVAAAHAHELIHRDLKPGNVIMAIEDSQLVAKIADFGLAKVLDAGGSATVTRTGTAMGTPAYMAPEQVRSAKNVDKRADVFSLGAILYELAAGQRAFGGEDTFAIYEAIAYGRYSALPDDIPDRMKRAIEGSLTPDLDARLPSVAAVLEIWAGDVPEPIPEWPPEVLESHDGSPTSFSSGGAETFDSFATGIDEAMDTTGLPTTVPQTLPPAIVNEGVDDLLIALTGTAGAGVASVLFTVAALSLVAPWTAEWNPVAGWMGTPAIVASVPVFFACGAWIGRRCRGDSLWKGAIAAAFAALLAFSLFLAPGIGSLGSSLVFEELANRPLDGEGLEQAMSDSALGTLVYLQAGFWACMGVAAGLGVAGAIVGRRFRVVPEVHAPVSTSITLSLSLSVTVACGVMTGAGLYVVGALGTSVGNSLGKQAGSGLMVAALSWLPALSGTAILCLSIYVMSRGAALAWASPVRGDHSEAYLAVAAPFVVVVFIGWFAPWNSATLMMLGVVLAAALFGTAWAWSASKKTGRRIAREQRSLVAISIMTPAVLLGLAFNPNGMSILLSLAVCMVPYIGPLTDVAVEVTPVAESVLTNFMIHWVTSLSIPIGAAILGPFMWLIYRGADDKIARDHLSQGN